MAVGDLSKGLRGVVRNLIGDQAGTGWSNAELYYYLNEGQRLLCRIIADGALWAVTDVEAADLSAGVVGYTLPTDYLRERLVKYKGLFSRRWKIKDLRAIEEPYPQCVPSEANPFHIIWQKKLIFYVGTVTQGDSEKYELWYIHRPADMTDGVDPELPSQFYNAMIDWAVGKAFEQKRDAGMAEVQKAYFYEQVDIINARYKGDKEAFDGIPHDPMFAAIRGEA